MMKALFKAAVVALAALGLSASGAWAAEASDCRLVKVGEFQVKFENNQPLVPVSINGKPGWFLIDTGADTSTMFGGAAVSYGLSQTTAGVQFYGVGGMQEANTVVVSDFALSGVKIRNMRMFVIGHSGSAERAGILGRDFLSLFDIEFDLAGKTIRFFQASNCGARSLAYWTKEGGMADLHQLEQGGDYKVNVLLNGKSVDAILDSGATTSAVTPEAAAIASIRKEDYSAGSHYMTGIGEKKVEFRIATFDTVTVGDEQIKHARLQVADMFAADTQIRTGSILPHMVEGHKPAMLLGADFLRSHRVLLAPGQHRLYFTYSGGPVFQVVGEAVAPETAADSADAAPPTPAK